MRRLDIGIASYKNPDRLERAIRSIRQQSTTDWRCFIIHNPADGPDDLAARTVIQNAAYTDTRFVPIFMDTNVGYAGSINELMRRAETEYIAYCDNDVEVTTPGWDEKLCFHLDRFHEIGVIFPNGGAYMIDRGVYHEVMWGVGFCFVVNRLITGDVGNPHTALMDEGIGHQNEADMCMRIRMAGWKCAAAPGVHVAHHATATTDPASIERINRGVVQFVDKWCSYFGGKNLNYHSANVLRWDDWPPNALYLEEWWKARLPRLNVEPEVVTLDGREYDLIKVPRYANFYRGRVI